MESLKIRPRIMISRCLGFEACRYNGQVIEVNYLNRLTRLVDQFLTGAGALDGFTLKSRSPTCGYCDVKIYSGLEKAPALTGEAAR